MLNTFGIDMCDQTPKYIEGEEEEYRKLGLNIGFHVKLLLLAFKPQSFILFLKITSYTSQPFLKKNFLSLDYMMEKTLRAILGSQGFLNFSCPWILPLITDTDLIDAVFFWIGGKNYSWWLMVYSEQFIKVILSSGNNGSL